MYAERLRRARERMRALDVDVLLLSTGADLPYLTGYEAMPLERLTMLVVPADADTEPVLVVPRLEAPRVVERPDAFAIRAWDETDDPIAVVASLVGRVRTAAIGDQTWARFVLALQAALPDVRFRRATDVTGPLRVVKDAAEIDALRAAAHAVDKIALAMRERGFAGRRELDVHRELVERMLDAGHQRANFAIVASGPNAASPHHDPTTRVIERGEVVLCDFGGTMDGY
ncbi:MAG: aminopeptidase P family N-terminal domain-containing protein, partial [Acidimicrobiia bacterium]